MVGQVTYESLAHVTYTNLKQPQKANQKGKYSSVSV